MMKATRNDYLMKTNQPSPKAGLLLTIVIAGILFTHSVSAQDAISRKYQFGLEYDCMAPRIGEWHSVNLSGSIGRGRIKHSLVFVKIDINDRHLTDESFVKDHLTAFGYRGEIYSQKPLKGWSAGVIVLYSMHEVVTSRNKQEGHFNTFFVGIPFGYTWRLWEHLTITPSVNILYPLTNRTVKIGSDEVEQAPWGFEPGLRIGLTF